MGLFETVDHIEKLQKNRFPFSAIVGNDLLKRALILNLVNKNIGGVLIEGGNGTGKSLTVDSFNSILPEIDVVKGCEFNCSPHEPDKFCLECKEKEKRGDLKVEKKPMEIVEIPLNISEDRLIGTIDVEQVLQEGEKSFEPGILARANRNILYIDQINLLDHHIVDLLLDVAAMDVVTVEREGISTDYRSDFILISSMNPEEGFLRPQLLDRFSLKVNTDTINDTDQRIQLNIRNQEFLEDPLSLRDEFKGQENEIIDNIERGSKLLDSVKTPERLLSLICNICMKFGIDGHRGDIIIEKTARTNAAYEGRNTTSVNDIILASELALPHRMRTQPFEKKEFSKESLEELVKEKMGYTD